MHSCVQMTRCMCANGDTPPGIGLLSVRRQTGMAPDSALLIVDKASTHGTMWRPWQWAYICWLSATLTQLE